MYKPTGMEMFLYDADWCWLMLVDADWCTLEIDTWDWLQRVTLDTWAFKRSLKRAFKRALKRSLKRSLRERIGAQPCLRHAGASLRNSASSFHRLSSSIFNVRSSFVRSFVRPSRIGNTSSHLHYMMFQTKQTIYFLWGYDPVSVNISLLLSWAQFTVV